MTYPFNQRFYEQLLQFLGVQASLHQRTCYDEDSGEGFPYPGMSGINPSGVYSLLQTVGSSLP